VVLERAECGQVSRQEKAPASEPLVGLQLPPEGDAALADAGVHEDRVRTRASEAGASLVDRGGEKHFVPGILEDQPEGRAERRVVVDNEKTHVGPTLRTGCRGGGDMIDASRTPRNPGPVINGGPQLRPGSRLGPLRPILEARVGSPDPHLRTDALELMEEIK